VAIGGRSAERCEKALAQRLHERADVRVSLAFVFEQSDVLEHPVAMLQGEGGEWLAGRNTGSGLPARDP
jgi:hypothetical protein